MRFFCFLRRISAYPKNVPTWNICVSSFPFLTDEGGGLVTDNGESRRAGSNGFSVRELIAIESI